MCNPFSPKITTAHRYCYDLLVGINIRLGELKITKISEDKRQEADKLIAQIAISLKKFIDKDEISEKLINKCSSKYISTLNCSMLEAFKKMNAFVYPEEPQKDSNSSETETKSSISLPGQLEPQTPPRKLRQFPPLSTVKESRENSLTVHGSDIKSQMHGQLWTSIPFS